MNRDVFPKKKRKMGKVILIAFATLFLLAIIAAGGAFLFYKHSLTAMESCDDICETVKFTVAENTGGAKIASDLEQAGLIRSALAFRIYLKFEASDVSLKPGEYDFSKNMDVEQIVKSLNQGVVAKTFKLTFLPGGTLAAARERLQKAGYTE